MFKRTKLISMAAIAALLGSSIAIVAGTSPFRAMRSPMIGPRAAAKTKSPRGVIIFRVRIGD
jgi:hypothetical protein